MNILVTGALGHIGSSLVRALPMVFPGGEIRMVDNLMTQRYCSLFNLPKEGNYRFIEADITQVDLAPLLEGVDVAVHLAAITDAAGSFGNAEQVEQNNFNSTCRLAAACADAGVRFITPSSTSVYTTQAAFVDEGCGEDELNPKSPYAITKLKEERLIRQLGSEKGLQGGIFRFGTIFGVSPGMRFHTAVNKFCWQATMGLPITVWSTAYDQKRPYLDLSDAVRAIIHAIKNDLFTGEIYNVVTCNVTVREVVDAIRAHIPALEVKFVDNQIMNTLSYDVLNARLASTGFRVEGNLEKRVAETLDLLKLSRPA